MNLVSRTVTGGVMTILGLILLVIPIFAGREGFIAWFYGVPLFILGLIIFFNSREDKIETIKHKGGKKQK